MNINELINNVLQKRVVINEYLQHKVQVEYLFYINYTYCNEQYNEHRQAKVKIKFIQNENFYTENCIKESIKSILERSNINQSVIINIVRFLTAIFKNDVFVELNINKEADCDVCTYSVERKYFG